MSGGGAGMARRKPRSHGQCMAWLGVAAVSCASSIRLLACRSAPKVVLARNKLCYVLRCNSPPPIKTPLCLTSGVQQRPQALLDCLACPPGSSSRFPLQLTLDQYWAPRR